MSEMQRGYVLWSINIIVVLLLGVLTWNANRVYATVDSQGVAIAKLNQEAVRWQIVAEDVREIKADMKQLLRRP